jgi:hypothetical protein
MQKQELEVTVILCVNFHNNNVRELFISMQ